MIAEGCPFKGVLYGGLMKTPNGIKVVEFNARFGDPETEVVLPRLTADIVDIFTAIIDGTTPVLTWDKRAAIGIVLASKGYPNNYEKGFEIKNLDRVDTTVYHMGTKRENDKIITNGGRVLFVTALADTLKEAREKANAEVAKIDCENLFYRTDIGWQAT
jgi:phosphoribosylamine--glycine ligase